MFNSLGWGRTGFDDNYFIGLRIHFYTMRVCLPVVGAPKTERGYNTRCKSFCSAMIGACAKWTALMNWSENDFRLWGRWKFNLFSTVHQSVNSPKSRAVGLLMDILFDIFGRSWFVFFFSGRKRKHVRIKLSHNSLRFFIETLISIFSRTQWRVKN